MTTCVPAARLDYYGYNFYLSYAVDHVLTCLHTCLLSQYLLLLRINGI